MKRRIPRNFFIRKPATEILAAIVWTTTPLLLCACSINKPDSTNTPFCGTNSNMTYKMDLLREKSFNEIINNLVETEKQLNDSKLSPDERALTAKKFQLLRDQLGRWQETFAPVSH